MLLIHMTIVAQDNLIGGYKKCKMDIIAYLNVLFYPH